MESIIERNKRIGADVKRAAFMVKQQQSYEFKKKYAAIRAREFVGMCDEHDKNYHVSVGGLDSITLFLFLHSIGIYCPGVSASYLEDRGNQAVHKALGLYLLARSNARMESRGQNRQSFRNSVFLFCQKKSPQRSNCYRIRLKTMQRCDMRLSQEKPEHMAAIEKIRE